MKRTLLTFFLVFGMMATEAQNVSYKWGAVQEFRNDEEKYSNVLLFDESGVVMEKFDFKNWKYYIEKYDQNLKLLYSKEAFLSGLGSTHTQTYGGSAVLNGKVYALILDWDPDAKESSLMAMELDDKGEEVRRFVLGTVSAEKRLRVPAYKFATSPDHSKLVAIGVYPFEKEETEKWHAVIYDDNQKKVVLDKKLVDTQVPQERYEVNDLLINNNGTVFSFKRWDIKKMGQFTAFVTMNTDGSVKRTDTDFGGKAIVSQRVFLNKQGQASAVGFVSNHEKDWGDMGAHYYFTVDEKGDRVRCTHESFGEEVFKLVYTGSAVKKEGQKIENEYKLVHFVEAENGDITLFIEKRDVNKSAIPQPPGATGIPPSDYTITQGQVIAFKLDNTGHRLWAADLKKIQKYKTMREGVFWGGIVPLVNNDEVYFLWNNIDFPLIPRTGLAIPGWIDAAGKKHTLDEYGGRMVHPTCLSGFDKNGNLLYAADPVQYALPLIEMYKGAVYGVSFNSKFFGQSGNRVLLVMEMIGGAAKGQAKYQLCIVTVQ